MTATVHALPHPRTQPVRAFHLVMTADPAWPDRYGITIQETYGQYGQGTLARNVATARPAQTGHFLEYVLAVVRASGHRATVLGPHRRDPILLDEAAGVRLAVTLLAAAPLNRGDRIRTIAAGVAAMSVEETYYWYALCTGSRSAAARRAIRTLLSDP